MFEVKFHHAWFLFVVLQAPNALKWPYLTAVTVLGHRAPTQKCEEELQPGFLWWSFNTPFLTSLHIPPKTVNMPPDSGVSTGRGSLRPGTQVAGSLLSRWAEHGLACGGRRALIAQPIRRRREEDKEGSRRRNGTGQIMKNREQW